MANPAPSRGPTNLLDYKPDQDVISPAAWKNNAALTFFKLLNNLQQVATLYPLLDPETSAKYIADWPFVETFEARSAMDTYPGGQGAVNVAVRKNVNKLLYTYLIKLLTPHCPKIDKALNVLEYNDDASPLHVRDAHGDIVERMPMVLFSSPNSSRRHTRELFTTRASRATSRVSKAPKMRRTWQSLMMMILLLFLQKQNLAFAVYLLGSVLSLPD